MCLVCSYAGPDTQEVTYKFSLGWGAYLASTHNIIYATIDGRGSSGRGDAWRHQVYRNLGTVEVQDQLEA